MLSSTNSHLNILFFLCLLLLCGVTSTIYAQGIPVDGEDQAQPQIPIPSSVPEQRLAEMARRFEEQGNFQQALDTYRQLAEKKPDHPIYYQGVLRNALYLKNFDLALSWIQGYQPKGITRNPADPLSAFAIEVDRGEVFYRMEQADSAFAIWRQALADVGFDANAYGKVVRTMLANRLMDEAIDVIRQARNKGADPTFMATDLAMVLRSRMEYAGAATEFLRAYQASPGRFGLIQREFALFPTTGDVVDSVVKAFEPYLTLGSNQDVRSLLVGFLLKSQRFDEALLQVRTLDSLSEKPGQQGFDFAQQFLKENQIHHARVLFQDVVDNGKVDDRLKTAARLGLAKCLEVEGKSRDALTQYEELARVGLTRPEGREARFRAGVVRLRDLKDAAGARSDFQMLLAAGIPRLGDQEVGLWLGDCFVKQGDIEAAKTAYVRASAQPRVNREPPPAILYVRLARLALWQGDYQTATEMLTQASKGRLDDDTVNDALVWSLFLTSARADSVALAIFARGDLLAFQDDHQQALAVFQDARSASRTGRVGQESLLREAMELRALGQGRAAADSLKSFLTLFPSSIQCEDVRFILGDILERDLGDYPAAIEQYEKILIDYPGGMHMEEVRRRIRSLETYKQS